MSDAIDPKAQELEEAKQYADKRIADYERLTTKAAHYYPGAAPWRRVHVEGVNLGCSLHGWFGNTMHCPDCTYGDVARWTLLDREGEGKRYMRAIEVKTQPPMSSDATRVTAPEAQAVERIDLQIVRAALTVLREDTTHKVLAALSLEALDRIESVLKGPR